MRKPSQHSVRGISLAALVGVVYGVAMRAVVGHTNSVNGNRAIALGFLFIVPFAIGWLSVTFAPRDANFQRKQWRSAALLRLLVFDVLVLLIVVPFVARWVTSTFAPNGFIYHSMKRVGAEAVPVLASHVAVMLIFMVGIICLIFAVPITFLSAALGGFCSGLFHRHSS